MYNEFYGFSERPFNVTTDPRFLFLTKETKEALSSILYGIHERRGIMVLFGEVGTGKTTLLKAAVKKLKNTVRIAFVFNTAGGHDSIMEMVLDAFGLVEEGERLSKASMFKRLKQYAESQTKAGRKPVVIIDEAQNLDFESLENWRLLSNLETEKGKMIQLVFAGQPELERKLKDHRMRQLDQRVSLRQYIIPLNKKQTIQYIDYRLKKVGGGQRLRQGKPAGNMEFFSRHS